MINKEYLYSNKQTIVASTVSKNAYVNIFYIKYSLLISVIGIQSLLIFNIENLNFTILQFIILGFICVKSVNFDITHPYTWFLPFYILYSVSFSILHTTNNLNVYVNELILINSTEYLWLAFVTFIISVTPKQYFFNLNHKPLLKIKLFNKFILFCSVIGVFVMCLYVLQSGVDTKKDIALDSSLFLTLGFYSIQFYTFSFVVVIISKLSNNIKLDKIFVISTVFVSLLVVFIVGERDFLLRIILITVLLYSLYIKKLSSLRLFIFGITSLIILSALQSFKNIFISSNNHSLNENNLIVSLLSGEFNSAGRNFYILNENNMANFFSHDITLITDIKFAFLNLPFINVQLETPTTWFNNMFYGDYVLRGGGKGFTLVGEGYINFGYVGVIVWFFILGFITKFVYKKASISIFWFIAYLLLIPIAIYSLRADLGILFSHIIKYITLPVMVIWLVSIFRKESKQSS